MLATEIGTNVYFILQSTVWNKVFGFWCHQYADDTELYFSPWSSQVRLWRFCLSALKLGLRRSSWFCSSCLPSRNQLWSGRLCTIPSNVPVVHVPRSRSPSSSHSCLSQPLPPSLTTATPATWGCTWRSHRNFNWSRMHQHKQAAQVGALIPGAILDKALCGTGNDYMRECLSPIKSAWQIWFYRVDVLQVSSVKHVIYPEICLV